TAERGGASNTGSSFHAVQRRLASLIPDAVTLEGGGTLEMAGLLAVERPRLDPPELIEDTTLRSHDVTGEPVVRFAAFLDGTQSTRVMQYLSGVPIVHPSVAAVIRARHDTRLY